MFRFTSPDVQLTPETKIVANSPIQAAIIVDVVEDPALGLSGPRPVGDGEREGEAENPDGGEGSSASVRLHSDLIPPREGIAAEHEQVMSFRSLSKKLISSLLRAHNVSPLNVFSYTQYGYSTSSSSTAIWRRLIRRVMMVSDKAVLQNAGHWSEGPQGPVTESPSELPFGMTSVVPSCLVMVHPFCGDVGAKTGASTGGGVGTIIVSQVLIGRSKGSSGI